MLALLPKVRTRSQGSSSWRTAAVRHSGHHCPRVKCGGRRNDKVVPHDNPRSLAVGRDVCLLFCRFVVSEPGTCGMPGGTNRGFLFSMSSDHHKTLPSAQSMLMTRDLISILTLLRTNLQIGSSRGYCSYKLIMEVSTTSGSCWQSNERAAIH